MSSSATAKESEMARRVGFLRGVHVEVGSREERLHVALQGVAEHGVVERGGFVWERRLRDHVVLFRYVACGLDVYDVGAVGTGIDDDGLLYYIH